MGARDVCCGDGRAAEEARTGALALLHDRVRATAAWRYSAWEARFSALLSPLAMRASWLGEGEGIFIESSVPAMQRAREVQRGASERVVTEV